MNPRPPRRVVLLAAALLAFTAVVGSAAAGATRLPETTAAADPMSPFVLGQGSSPVSAAAPFGTAVAWLSSSDGRHVDRITTCRVGQGVRRCANENTLTPPTGVTPSQLTIDVSGATVRVVAVGCCAGDAHGSYGTSVEWISTDSGVTFGPAVEQTLGEDSTAQIAPDGSVWTVNAQSAKGLIVQHQPAGLSTPTTAFTKVSPDLVGPGPRGRFAFVGDGSVLLVSEDLTTKAVVVFRYDGSTWTQVLSAPGEELNDLSDALVRVVKGTAIGAGLFTHGTTSGLSTSLIVRTIDVNGSVGSPFTMEPTAYYYRAMLASDAAGNPHVTWYLAGGSVLQTATSVVYPYRFVTRTLAKLKGVAAGAGLGPWTETLDANGAGLLISASGPSVTGSIVAIPVLLEPTFLQLLHRYTTHAGSKVVVRTTMPTMPPGTTVALQVSGRHGFATVARTTVTARHSVSFGLRPARPGSKSYRLQVPGRAGAIEPKHSATFVVTAQP